MRKPGRLEILSTDLMGPFPVETPSGGKGIIAKQSLPYHHYQNGVIERFNQTVAETGRTVLSNSKLPKLFWGFAFIWANHLLNRISNKKSGKKTPYKVLFNQVPHFDAFWVFGLKAYIHVPPEKRKKLDNCALEEVVVGHLAPSKGWLFYIPSEDWFKSSSMVNFVSSISLGTLITSIVPQMSDLKEGDQQSIVHLKPPEDPSISKVLSNNTANKISLDFIPNQLTLGNFRAGCELGNQELLIDAILEGCEFFGVNILHTYKQAMKSNEEKAWRAAIEEELTNLRSMEVWTPAKLPPNKLALDGWWVFARKSNPNGNPDRFKAWFVAKSIRIGCQVSPDYGT
ncbi:hypothetical protein PCANC_23888 [Puccinia coronata f. sp. avenae]|uniref:Integrase catalytic domain-containing protein n=1 Tax=Puccinia coronata f. sp. avenae TaxID=200324 RepID=A0A2N5TZ47_9BASI|nr:hypothetical protein PCANC_23888 [Puccinia coronata f. sp. avenae]